MIMGVGLQVAAPTTLMIVPVGPDRDSFPGVPHGIDA